MHNSYGVSWLGAFIWFRSLPRRFRPVGIDDDADKSGLPAVNVVDPFLDSPVSTGPTSTNTGGPVPERGMLIEKICRLQRTNARKQEKLEYELWF